MRINSERKPKSVEEEIEELGQEVRERQNIIAAVKHENPDLNLDLEMEIDKAVAEFEKDPDSDDKLIQATALIEMARKELKYNVSKFDERMLKAMRPEVFREIEEALARLEADYNSSANFIEASKLINKAKLYLQYDVAKFEERYEVVKKKSILENIDNALKRLEEDSGSVEKYLAVIGLLEKANKFTDYDLEDFKDRLSNIEEKRTQAKM